VIEQLKFQADLGAALDYRDASAPPLAQPAVDLT
jgi:hypothetical protein